MGYRLAVVVVVAVILSGCMQRVESLQIDTPSCPPVAIVAAGRIMNFYRVDLEIAGREPLTLVPNIDMPGDESRYILGLRKSPDGVQILISGSKYVRDADLKISSQCRVTTVRPNSAFKPTSFRGLAQAADGACHPAHPAARCGLT